MKRLFLFSSFDKNERISAPLAYYLEQLSKFGDIVFVADNYISDNDRKEIIPYTIHIIANGKHGEYDWGSYKRGYEWAKNKDILKKYEWVYCANDSMFLISPRGKTAHKVLADVFEKIETLDAGCIYYMKSKINNRFIAKTILNRLVWNSMMQSWFFGISQNVVNQSWFKKFIMGVAPIKSKRDFISKYEVGFSNICKRNDVRIKPFLSDFKNWPFREPLWLFLHGAPFIKKNSVGYPKSKTNIQEFKLLNTNEEQMIMDEIKFQVGDAEFKKLSLRTKPYIYKRFLIFSVRRQYNEHEKYISNFYIFKWRVCCMKSN